MILFVFNSILLTEFLYNVLLNNSTIELIVRKSGLLSFSLKTVTKQQIAIEMDGIIKEDLSINNNTLFM